MAVTATAAAIATAATAIAATATAVGHTAGCGRATAAAMAIAVTAAATAMATAAAATATAIAVTAAWLRLWLPRPVYGGYGYGGYGYARLVATAAAGCRRLRLRLRLRRLGRRLQHGLHSVRLDLGIARTQLLIKKTRAAKARRALIFVDEHSAVRVCGPRVLFYASTLAASALSWMKMRRGSTSSPISLAKMSLASSISFTLTCSSERASVSSVVSQSCSGFISPRPL